MSEFAPSVSPDTSEPTPEFIVQEDRLIGWTPGASTDEVYARYDDGRGGSYTVVESVTD